MNADRKDRSGSLALFAVDPERLANLCLPARFHRQFNLLKAVHHEQ
jgi:hypothetical protein